MGLRFSKSSDARGTVSPNRRDNALCRVRPGDPRRFEEKADILRTLAPRCGFERIAHPGTNWAEEFFSRMRRAEQGHHHHIAGPYLLRYAQEASWREDHRRISNGDQAHMVFGLAMKRGPSVDFCGYWQRRLAV